MLSLPTPEKSTKQATNFMLRLLSMNIFIRFHLFILLIRYINCPYQNDKCFPNELIS